MEHFIDNWRGCAHGCKTAQECWRKREAHNKEIRQIKIERMKEDAELAKETIMSFVQISAGSEYGRRDVLYEVVEDFLVLRHEGNDDGLSGNGEALDFEGLTKSQAEAKAAAINQEPVGHNYDGCHACQFSVTVRDTKAPEWYTQRDPPEAEIIKAALAEYRQVSS